MGKRYDQLDLDDRIEISRLHAAGSSRREIGHLMGRNASTISRELRRNSLPRGEYKPASANRIALSRRWRLARSTYYDAPAAQSVGEAEIVERIATICAEFPRYGDRRVTA